MGWLHQLSHMPQEVKIILLAFVIGAVLLVCAVESIISSLQSSKKREEEEAEMRLNAMREMETRRADARAKMERKFK